MSWLVSAAFSHVAPSMLDPPDLVSSSDGDDESVSRKRAYGSASVEFACSYAWMHAYVRSSLPFLNLSYPSLQNHVEATFADAIWKGQLWRCILLEYILGLLATVSDRTFGMLYSLGSLSTAAATINPEDLVMIEYF